ncbi:MAG: Histidine kinase [Hyphomicrobiales bacterium]|nr:Histidine kinase [Hyphomicrobiales bacterium]
MPSLIRFLVFVGALAGLAFGGMLALTMFVEPQPREMSQPLPANKLNR